MIRFRLYSGYVNRFYGFEIDLGQAYVRFGRRLFVVEWTRVLAFLRRLIGEGHRKTPTLVIERPAPVCRQHGPAVEPRPLILRDLTPKVATRRTDAERRGDERGNSATALPLRSQSVSARPVRAWSVSGEDAEARTGPVSLSGGERAE